MKKITLWSTGLDYISFTGDIELSMFDKRTNDFEIRMKLNTLQQEGPSFKSEKPLVNVLQEFPIQSLEYEGYNIIPVWKPNRYGEPADNNEYQSVESDNGYLILSVHANGTAKEVFERNTPYHVYNSDELVTLSYDINNDETDDNVSLGDMVHAINNFIS